MLDFGFYNMDCMEGMKQFPDKFFDLAVVDPPYGDGTQLSDNSRGGVLEQIRSEVRQVHPDTFNGRTCGNRMGRGVTRIGGTWAGKFSKKLLRGTWRRPKSILKNSSASHGIKLFGAEITLTCHRRDAFLYGVKAIYQNRSAWQWLNMLGLLSTQTQRCFPFRQAVKREGFTRHRNQLNYTSGF